MKLKITGKTEKPFKGDEGDLIPYFWYKAVREEDGVTLQFGSKKGEHLVGDTLELELEKTEALDSKTGQLSYRYKETAL